MPRNNAAVFAVSAVGHRPGR